MNNNAVITISSVQMHDPTEKIEVSTVGSFSKQDGYYEAIYEESEISGMEGTTTILRVSGNSVTLIREGTTSTTMNFDKNSNSIALYNTPYGMLQFKIVTKKLDINIKEDGGNVNISYGLEVAGQPPINTNLNLSIKLHN